MNGGATMTRDRRRCRALHHVGRVLWWWSHRPAMRGTDAGRRALLAAGQLMEIRGDDRRNF
jgi:hypothetical protein